MKNLRKSAFSMPRLGINKMISVGDTDSGNQSLNRIRVNIYSNIASLSLHHSRALHWAKISICNENVATWRPRVKQIKGKRLIFLLSHVIPNQAYLSKVRQNFVFIPITGLRLWFALSKIKLQRYYAIAAFVYVSKSQNQQKFKTLSYSTLGTDEAFVGQDWLRL